MEALAIRRLPIVEERGVVACGTKQVVAGGHVEQPLLVRVQRAIQRLAEGNVLVTVEPAQVRRWRHVLRRAREREKNEGEVR